MFLPSLVHSCHALLSDILFFFKRQWLQNHLWIFLFETLFEWHL